MRNSWKTFRNFKILQTTKKSYLVEVENKRVVLPTSQIEIDKSGNLVMPIWLAKERGLVKTCDYCYG